MDMLDQQLSTIDTIGYIQSSPAEQMPSLLDITLNQDAYKFELMTAHLWEKHVASRVGRPVHHHDVYHLVLYVGGEGSFNLNGVCYSAQRGRLVLVSPHQPHSFAPGEGWVVYHEVTFALRSARAAFTGTLADVLSHYTGRSGTVEAIQDLDASTFGVLKGQMEQFVTEVKASPVNWFSVCRLMIDFLGQVAALSIDSVADAVFPALEVRARAYVAANLSNPKLSLRGMADDLNVSPEHLCRHMRKKMGMAPMTYRNHLRAQAARNLLRSTNLPCKAIASRLGYSDLYAFSKAYYRITGRRPSSERNSGAAT